MRGIACSEGDLCDTVDIIAMHLDRHLLRRLAVFTIHHFPP